MIRYPPLSSVYINEKGELSLSRIYSLNDHPHVYLPVPWVVFLEPNGFLISECSRKHWLDNFVSAACMSCVQWHITWSAVPRTVWHPKLPLQGDPDCIAALISCLERLICSKATGCPCPGPWVEVVTWRQFDRISRRDGDMASSLCRTHTNWCLGSTLHKTNDYCLVVAHICVQPPCLLLVPARVWKHIPEITHSLWQCSTCPPSFCSYI